MAAIRQVKTKTVTISWVMSRRAFLRGYEDVKAGRPFADDERDVKLQWLYERGRLFACLYDGPVKSGRDVTKDAQRIYVAALRQNFII